MGLFSFLFKKTADDDTSKNKQYKEYPDDLKAWSENRDKYADIWKKYNEYHEKIDNYYSNFINNGLNQSDLTELENYGNKYLEIIPSIVQSLKSEKEINKDTNMNINEQIYYSYVYKKLALAYEKQGNYQKAIDVCRTSINKGIVDDGTKNGFPGRMEKLKKKLDK